MALPDQYLAKPGTEESAGLARAVDISSTDHTLDDGCRALYVGVAGDVVVRLAEDDIDVTFTAMPAGIHAIRVKIVRKAGTAATNMVALY